MKNDQRISKFLSLILRHKPEEVGLKLDDEGWINVEVLIKAVKSRYASFTRVDLERIVAECEKQRYSFNDTLDLSKQKIRANQGHSITVDLKLEPTIPPQNLYHGTATRFIDSIYLKGLIPNGRQYVHLSEDLETAKRVGVRHGNLYIFRVLSGDMHNDGFKFFLSDNGVWLTDHVPQKYLSMY